MRVSLPDSPTSRHYLIAFALGFALVLLPSLVFGQAESADRTGVFGPVLDQFWPVIVTFLTSVTLKVVTLFNKGAARLPEPAKWAALYFLALGWNVLARLLDLGEVDPNAPLFAMSFVEMGAAGLIYKFAGHQAPASR